VSDIAAAAAGVLALVFAWAGIAKLRTQPATAASFRGLGLPAPTALARAVPAAELAVAAGLVAAPALAAWVALVLLLAFTFVIGRAVVAGSTVSCACFGSAASTDGDDERPVSVVELVRNAGLGALAIVASGAGAGPLARPALPALVIVTVLVALARVAFAAVELRRLGGHVWSTPLPGDGLR
jgi:uncharacterized membrane protein YphA (DoxX/SURF4 family)